MKKFIVAGMLTVTLLVGFANKSNAEEEELICGTVVVDCHDGTGGYGGVCGTTYEEIEEQCDEMAEVICGG